MPLPTNIAGSYPDRGPGDLAHQEHHDTVHAAVNEVNEGRLTEAALSATIASKVDSGVAPLYYGGFASLRTALDSGQTCAIQVLSDSTANENWEWPHLFGQAIAAEYPNYRVEWRHWDDAAQDFTPANVEVIQNPGERYMNMVNGSYPRRLPSSYTPHLTGTIDVRITVNLADWTPSNPFGAEVLIGEGGGTGAWSWSLALTSYGPIRLYYSTDGTTLESIESTAATGIADGTTATIRCVFTPDDGAGNRVAKFYKWSGSAWTQIGSTVTTAGAVTLYNPLAAGETYKLGNPGAATNTTAARIYDVQVRDGENGPDIVPRLPDVWAQYGAGTTHPMVGPPVLTIVTGAEPGAMISYLNDPARRQRLTPDYGQVVTFLSVSHNEARDIGRTWFTEYAEWVTDVRARMGTPLVALTQNPQTPGAVYHAEHARRRSELVGFARSLNVDLIDTYAEFVANPTWQADYMTDSVHPNAAGQQLVADTIKAAFDAL